MKLTNKINKIKKYFSEDDLNKISEIFREAEKLSKQIKHEIKINVKPSNKKFFDGITISCAIINSERDVIGQHEFSLYISKNEINSEYVDKPIKVKWMLELRSLWTLIVQLLDNYKYEKN